MMIAFIIKASRIILGVCLIISVILITGLSAAETDYSFGPAENDHFFENWKPVHFRSIKSYTTYEIVHENGHPVLKAISESSASGISRMVTIDPVEYPYVSWKWKITGYLPEGEADDCPARMYLYFRISENDRGFFDRMRDAAMSFYSDNPPDFGICYIWSNKREAKETAIKSSVTERIGIVVIENRNSSQNIWVAESRNILLDFVEIFGENPPIISGIAFMTDTDDTTSKTVSFYGNVVFSSGTNK